MSPSASEKEKVRPEFTAPGVILLSASAAPRRKDNMIEIIVNVTEGDGNKMKHVESHIVRLI